MNWYWLAIIGLIMFGVQNFLYKVSAKHKCNSAWTSFSFMGTVFILSSGLFVFTEQKIDNSSVVLFLAIAGAVVFVVSTITRMEALKHIPVNIAYPILNQNKVFVVIFGMVYFNEILSIYQLMGVAIAIIVIFLLTKKREDKELTDKDFKLGLILIGIAFVTGFLSSIIIKFSAMLVNILGYIAIVYFFNMLFSFLVRKKVHREDDNDNHKVAIIIGIIIGVVNFIGFYAVLQAMKMGPLSIIAIITGFGLIVATILSILIYNEKLTQRKLLAIVLSIVSIILLGI